MTTRDQLKSLGISEQRLAAIGLGPSKPVATAGAAQPNPFRQAYDKAHAPKLVTAEARAAKVAALAALPDAELAHNVAALTYFRKYDKANPIERAVMRGANSPLIELGRQLDALDADPEPPAAA